MRRAVLARSLTPAHALRGPRLHASMLAAALMATAVAASPASASPQGSTFPETTNERTYSCVMPLIGRTVAKVTIATGRASVSRYPSFVPVDLTVDLTAGELLKNLNATSLQGKATPTFGLNTVSGSLPLVTPVNVSSSADGILRGTGSTPAFETDEWYSANLSIESLSLNLSARKSDGSPVQVKPVGPDSDGDPNTFDVACTLAPETQPKLLVKGSVDCGCVTPPGPISVTATATTASLSWGAAVSDTAVVGYEVSVAGRPTVNVTGTSVTLTGLADNTNYTVSIVAIDARGIRSQATTKSWKTMTYGLAVPGPITPTPDGRFTWPAVPGAVQYLATLAGCTVGEKTVSTNAVGFDGLVGDCEYTLRVFAIDANGNRSQPGETTFVAGPTVETRRYTLDGQVDIKTLTRGAFRIGGTFDLTLNGTVATGTLAVTPAQARLITLGFLPVTARIAFVTNGPTTGTADGAVLRTKTLVRLKLQTVKLFGAVPLAGGNNCQTKSLTTLELGGSDPRTTQPVAPSLEGQFAISDLNGCGVLNGLVSPLTAGGGNSFRASLTPTGLSVPAGR